MPSLLEIGLANAVCAGLLALVAMAAGRVCRRPAILHGLWLLVLVKLVTPPLFAFPLRVLPAEEPVAVASTPRPEDHADKPRGSPSVEEMPVTGQFLLLPPQNDGEVVVAIKLNGPLNVAPPAPVEPEPIVAAPPEPVPPTFDWSVLARILVSIWAAGAIAWFAISIVRMARFQRVLRHATPAPAEFQTRAADLARLLGLSRCPEIMLVPGSVPPMLWTAVGRPRVYLPAELLTRLESAEGDTLLAHELAHLRRGDHWVRWIEFAVQGLYWWLPLVPFARRQVQAHEEECCDALVVGMLPARTYAAAIVHTLDFLAGAAPLPAHASALTRVAAMKRRLLRIMTGGVAGRLGFAGRLALLTLAAGALPLLPTLARSVSEPRAFIVDEAEAIEVASEEMAGELICEEPPGDDSAAPRALAASRDGKWLALALENHTIELRDALSGRTVRVLAGHAGPVNCVAFSPDGTTLASGSSDRTVRLWDAAGGELKMTLKGHGHWVYALAFTPDGRTLASGGYDRSIRLWNVKSGKCAVTLRGHEAAVRALAFAPDGRTLASGGGDRDIRLWDTTTRKLRTMLSGHRETVRTLAFSPDGRTLASGGDDGTARMWDATGGPAKAILIGHTSEVTSLAFAPWGPVLVTGGADRGLKLWDSASGKAIANLPGGREGVVGLAFASGDGALTTLGPDREVRRLPLARVTLRTAPRIDAREYVLRSGGIKYYRATTDDVWVAEGPRMIIVDVRPEVK
jgi:beta-lactamase regulating signal transducer with metallopeptidase domain